jgi:hypothetical protein
VRPELRYVSAECPLRNLFLGPAQHLAVVTFGVWASIILITLAMLSVALGAAPIRDPQICAGC